MPELAAFPRAPAPAHRAGLRVAPVRAAVGVTNHGSEQGNATKREREQQEGDGTSRGGAEGRWTGFLRKGGRTLEAARFSKHEQAGRRARSDRGSVRVSERDLELLGLV